MSDWESRALEAERQLAEQQEKTKRLVEAVSASKEKWTSEIESLKAQVSSLESELEIKSEQLSNVTYRLDSLVALNEKNAKEDNPDRLRVNELEQRLLTASEGLTMYKRQLEQKSTDLAKQKTDFEVKISLLEKEITLLQEQLKVASDRAFDADGRLGREQALNRELSSQLNMLRLGKTPTTSSTPAANKKPSTTVDELDFGDLEAELAEFTKA